jgi:starch synthase
MIWVNHPFGNANVRAVLKAFYDAGKLDQFFTTIGFSNNSSLIEIFPNKLQKIIARKHYDLPKKKLNTDFSKELFRQMTIQLPFFNFLSKNENNVLSIDSIWKNNDKKMAHYLMNTKSTPSAIYCYEDGAVHSFRVAKKRGITCIYDLPIGYFKSAQKIYQEEKALNPEFASMLEGSQDSSEKLSRKEEEANISDVIFSCSPFVTQTLIENKIPKNKIYELQFGAPESTIPKNWMDNAKHKPLKILFVGRITQRKGIGYLLKAMQKLGKKNFHLTIIGRVSTGENVFFKFSELFTYIESLPQMKIFEYMRRADVLVLPSLFEGQALVVLEAMKCKIPVIVTPNTGTDQVVRDNLDGFIIPIRSHLAIAEKLEWMFYHKDELSQMGDSAYNRIQCFTWENYRNQISENIKSLNV